MDKSPAFAGSLYAALAGIISTRKQRNNSLFSWPFARQLHSHLSLSLVGAHVGSAVSIPCRQGFQRPPLTQAASAPSSSLASKKYLPEASLLPTPASQPSLMASVDLFFFMLELSFPCVPLLISTSPLVTSSALVTTNSSGAIVPSYVSLVSLVICI